MIYKRRHKKFCKKLLASGQKLEGFKGFESPENFCPRAASEAPPQSGGVERSAIGFFQEFLIK